MQIIAETSVADLTKTSSIGRRARPLLAATILVAGCASAPGKVAAKGDADRPDVGPPGADRVNDPAEPVNRVIFAGNQFVDRNALQPVARGYQANVPGVVRGSIRNFVGNLGEPQVAVNEVLQGNLGRAWDTTQRFAVNTTVGGLGLFDAATDCSLPHRDADFGETLGVWDVGPRPAVQLPLFGPSNVRDSLGRVLGLVANPLSFVPATAVASAAGGGLGVVDGRARLLHTTDALEHQSLDYYATLRSINAQRRAALVADGISGGTSDAAKLEAAK